MPQEVHERMAESAKQSYIKCRQAGEDDLMLIMTTIADDMTKKWDQYDRYESYCGELSICHANQALDHPNRPP
jgi:hypothetical protein